MSRWQTEALNSSCDLRTDEKIWRKRIGDSMNNKAVYRTAPATPGLLKIHKRKRRGERRGWWRRRVRGREEK